MQGMLQALTRNPNEYVNAKTLPHVQVALRMNQAPYHMHMKHGDTVEYVVCEVSLLCLLLVDTQSRLLCRMARKMLLYRERIICVSCAISRS